MKAINTGEQTVVGLNKWTEGLPSPLLSGAAPVPGVRVH